MDATKPKSHLADFINKNGMKQVDERLKFLSNRIAELMSEITPLQEEFTQLRETKTEMVDFINSNKKATS